MTNLEKAIEYFKHALNIDKNNALAHFNLGICYRVLKKDAEAAPHIALAEQLDPQFAQLKGPPNN